MTRKISSMLPVLEDDAVLLLVVRHAADLREVETHAVKPTLGAVAAVFFLGVAISGYD